MVSRLDSDLAIRCVAFLPPSTIDSWLSVDAASREKVASWMVHSEFVALGNRVPDLAELQTGFIARVIPSLAGDGDDFFGNGQAVELPPWTLDHIGVRMREWNEECRMIDRKRWLELLQRGFGETWQTTLWSRRHGPIVQWIAECIQKCCAQHPVAADDVTAGTLQVSTVGAAIVAALGGNPWVDENLPIPALVVAHDFHETIVHRCLTLAEAGNVILERCMSATEIGDPQHCLSPPGDSDTLDDILLSFDLRPRCSHSFLSEYFNIDGRTTMIKSANPRASHNKKAPDRIPNFSIDVLRMRDWELGFTDDPLCGHVVRVLADMYQLTKLDLRMSRGSGDLGMFRNIKNIAHVRTPFITKEVSEEAFSLFPDLVSVNMSYSVEMVDLHGFRLNPKLRTIRFPPPLRRVLAHAFSDSPSLRRVDLSTCSQLTYVDGFDRCPSLLHIMLPPSLEEIGPNAFTTCCSLSTIDLSVCPRLTRIDGFADCPRLVSIELPRSLSFIGPTAFRRCVALARVDLTKCSPVLEVYGFAECDSLSRVSLAPKTAIQAGFSGRHENVFIERLPEVKPASPRVGTPARAVLAVCP